MIVGFCRKEKGGGERARPRKLLSISSSRGSVTLSPSSTVARQDRFFPQPSRYARDASNNHCRLTSISWWAAMVTILGAIRD